MMTLLLHMYNTNLYIYVHSIITIVIYIIVCAHVTRVHVPTSV